MIAYWALSRVVIDSINVGSNIARAILSSAITTQRIILDLFFFLQAKRGEFCFE